VSQFADQELSSDWEALTSVGRIQSNRPGYGIVSLATSQYVARGQSIKYTPTVDPAGFSVNPAHCDILGDKGVWPADSLKNARWFANNCTIDASPDRQNLIPR
jgi:hypothetical protein